MNIKGFSEFSEEWDRQMKPLLDAMKEVGRQLAPLDGIADQLFPKIDASAILPKIDMSGFFSKVDVSQLLPQSFLADVGSLTRLIEPLTDVAAFDVEHFALTDPVDERTRLAELHEELHAEAEEEARRRAEEDDRPMPGQYL